MTVLLIGLAAARLTRLWRDDALTEGLRGRVDDWLTVDFDDQSRWARFSDWLSTMLECSWCLSVWIAGAMVLFVDSATPRSVDLPLISWFAACWVAIAAYWLAELIADHDSLAWNERENKGLS